MDHLKNWSRTNCVPMACSSDAMCELSARSSRHRLHPEEGGSVCGRRFLAWLAVARLGAQALTLLDRQAQSKPRAGPSELQKAKVTRMEGYPALAASGHRQS